MSLAPSSNTAPRQALPAGLDAIFVIHATSFVERRQFIEAQMAELGLPFEFVLDFDVPSIPEDLRQQLFHDDKLSPAQQSCALKHWKAHRLIAQSKLSRALILEDDVIFSAQFLPALKGLMKKNWPWATRMSPFWAAAPLLRAA